MIAGVNPGAVQAHPPPPQRPRITTDACGHLQPDDPRSEIDRLRSGNAPANDLFDEKLTAALTAISERPDSRRFRSLLGGVDGT